MKNYQFLNNPFLLNHRAGARWPLLAAFLSHKKIQPQRMAEFLKILIKNEKNKNFLFFSIKKEKNENQSINDNTIHFFAKINKISIREVDDLFHKFPLKIEKKLKKIDEFFNSTSG